jgi:hypothetical protein
MVKVQGSMFNVDLRPFAALWYSVRRGIVASVYGLMQSRIPALGVWRAETGRKIGDLGVLGNLPVTSDGRADIQLGKANLGGLISRKRLSAEFAVQASRLRSFIPLSRLVAALQRSVNCDNITV